MCAQRYATTHWAARMSQTLNRELFQRSRSRPSRENMGDAYSLSSWRAGVVPCSDQIPTLFPQTTVA